MKKSDTSEMKTKDLSVKGVKVLDEEKGIVEAFVAGIGNRDSVNDIIQAGAFEDSIKNRNPKGVWSHDWQRPVSKTLEIREVASGSSELPQKMKEAGIGGLYVKTQFNLDTQDGRDALSWVKFFGEESEWSIGYKTVEEEWDKKKKANLLHKVDLFEYSPVIFGANSLTATVGVKVEVSTDQENNVKIDVVGADAKTTEAIAEAVKTAIESTDQETDSTDVETEEKTDEGTESTTLEEEASEEKSEDAEGSEEESGEEKGSGEPESDADDGDSEEKADEESSADELEEEKSDDEVVDEDEEKAEDDEPEDAVESEDDDEKGLSPMVESFMGFAEKARFSNAEAKNLIDFIEGRVEEKAVQGSTEQRLGMIAKALREEFADSGSYVYLYATFDSTVIFYKADYRSGDAGYYEASYSIDGDSISFEEEKEVDVVEVVVAKAAFVEAAFKGHAEAVKSLLSPFVDVSTGVAGDPDVKQAVIDGIEAKAGRKLSKKSRSLIEEAVDSLKQVLSADTPEDSDEKEESDEGEKSEESEKSEEIDEVQETSEATEEVEEKSDDFIITAEELAELQLIEAELKSAD